MPPLWKNGITGKRRTIAILDTGIDLTHPDLDDLDFRHWTIRQTRPRWTPARSSTHATSTAAPARPVDGGFDRHGHGTHVAGIAAGTGEGDPTTAADDGRVMGMAPDAKLGVGKVLTDAGAGLNSDLIAAMEWAAMPAGSGPAALRSARRSST